MPLFQARWSGLSASLLGSHTMATLDHDRRNKKPRMLSESERERLDEFIDSIHYSSRSTSSFLPRL